MAMKITSYIHEAKNELKKVIWPSRREAVINTLWVIGVSVAFAILFTIVDYFLNKGFEAIISTK